MVNLPFPRDLRKLIKYEERKKEVQHELDEIDKQPPVRQSKVARWKCTHFIFCSGT